MYLWVHIVECPVTCKAGSFYVDSMSEERISPSSPLGRLGPDSNSQDDVALNRFGFILARLPQRSGEVRCPAKSRAMQLRRSGPQGLHKAA
jgi:hypothetical protein